MKTFFFFRVSCPSLPDNCPSGICVGVPVITNVSCLGIPNVAPPPPPPPWYVQLAPELILLAGVASIATVLYKRWLKPLLSRLVKPRLVKAAISALGGLTLGLSYYLHSVDHPVFVPEQGPCSPPSVSFFRDELPCPTRATAAMVRGALA